MKIAKRAWPMMVLAIVACSETRNPTAVTPMEPDATRVTPQMSVSDMNPDPASWGPLPDPVWVDIPERPPLLGLNADPSGLSPTTLTATLKPGETVSEHKTVTLAGSPPKGDVLFSFDLTGSMGGELANLKTNAVSIMTAVAGVIPDAAFGLISYEDYNGVFTTSVANGQACNYGPTTYGSGGDQPYRRDRAITTSLALVQTSINAMTLKGGADGPESYSRAFFETYSDAGIAWRPGARRIVVNFGDNIPHDCNYDAIIGGGNDSGHDPGRDNIIGTADDLHILSVLGGMAANNTTLINLNSGGGGINPLWNAYAAQTPSGVNFLINADGTFPGGVNPATKIAELIQAAVQTISSLTLQVCPGSEAYAAWLQSKSPLAHTNFAVPATKEFDIAVGPPAGTAAGTYTFEICAVGDGAEYGRQTVTITVYVNQPPTANAGPDQTVECTTHSGGNVTLAGSASDPDNDITSVKWYEGATEVADGLTPTITLGTGVHTLKLLVTDATGFTASDFVVITIVDTTAPTATLTVTPANLWPPNHKYEVITVGLTVADGCSTNAGLIISATVVSNEADDANGTGDGNTTGDIRVTRPDNSVALSSNASPEVSFNPLTDKLEVRAERFGTAAPRIYTITVNVKDQAGNVTTVTATVKVDHDQGGE